MIGLGMILHRIVLSLHSGTFTPSHDPSSCSLKHVMVDPTTALFDRFQSLERGHNKIMFQLQTATVINQ